MEIFLLIVAIALLAFLVKTVSDKFEILEYRLRDLNRSIELLKEEKKAEEKPAIEKPAAVVPPPVIPEPVKERPALPHEVPIVPLPEMKEEKEKVVFHADAAVPKAEPVKPIPYVPEQSWWDGFKERNPDLEKFIGENLINKIGVLILVLGISYFVKFAIDKDWINEPARVGIGILCGALVMGFAHKLRKKYAPFSSVLVAGAISIFYFTIGIAFHDYHLFNQTVAFVIMVVITAFSCVISLSYDRIELAILSLIGGFAVPFMVATGEGNYAMLFTYITILDIGILALAYHKKWNLINILSYAFTVLLYGAWLFKDINEVQPHYAGALVFAFVFYFIFIGISIINNIRTKGAFSITELTILSTNTFLFYAAGMVILSHFHPEYKGLFTTLLALLNLAYAWILYKKFGMDKTAVYLLIGLTLTFATLAVPIQFAGHYITLFWAAEAVLLMWLGQKSKITSYRFGSVAVHFLMVISLVMDWNNLYNSNAVLNIIANPICITGIFAVASLFMAHWLLKNETEHYRQFGINFIPQDYSKFTGICALVIAYFTGLFESYYQANDYIPSVDSAAAVPIVYHMLFCALLVYFLLRQKTVTGYMISAFISALNIVLFVFVFTGFAFEEHRAYVATESTLRIAFYLHYISLAVVVYFGFQLYKIQKESAIIAFRHPAFVWVFALFIVCIASSELMLHALVMSNSPVTPAEIKAELLDFGSTDSDPYLKISAAYKKIHGIRTQVIKTGFPVLWGILAFIFLIAGIKKPSKPLRIIALALLGITILKLFLFDIRNASETGKIVAFILLGVLILIISFVYQKIKLLVIDDKPIPNESE
jgi:uncharacterized membrane protein